MSSFDPTNKDVRIACAEKMGWHIYGWGRDWHIGDGDGTTQPFIEDGSMNIKDLIEKYYPDYEHDRNALQTLIEAVPEDKREDFLNVMISNLNLDVMLFDSALEGGSPHGTVPAEIFKLLTADPLAVMRAFLEVME